MRAASRLQVAATVMALAIILAACQQEDTTVDTGVQPAGSPAASPSPPPAASPSPSPAAAGTTVQAVDSMHGQILADAGGRTLYAFMNDGGGQSNCYDACAQRWPALVSTGAPQAGAGANGALLGSSQRRDGSSQVTYNGRPLYQFSGDQGPGQTNGQGVGGVWFVVSPAGEPVR